MPREVTRARSRAACGSRSGPLEGFIDKSARIASEIPVSLRRFVIGWTALAFVVWLFAVDAFQSDEDCGQSSAYVCFDAGKAVLAGVLFVGVPWLVGLLLGAGIAGIVRRRRTRPSRHEG